MEVVPHWQVGEDNRGSILHAVLSMGRVASPTSAHGHSLSSSPVPSDNAEILMKEKVVVRRRKATPRSVTSQVGKGNTLSTLRARPHLHAHNPLILSLDHPKAMWNSFVSLKKDTSRRTTGECSPSDLAWPVLDQLK